MKLTAKINGVHQEIELSKEDVYVVECGDSYRANRVLGNIDKAFKTSGGWEYVCNKPLFKKCVHNFGEYITDTEPIPPDTPIISFEDWERLMESDKEEPKPTKWRFKTQKEFDDTCEKDEDGDYICGGKFFTKKMFYLFGKEYVGSPDNLIKHDDWNITPEMLMLLEKPNNMIPNDPNWGEVKEKNSETEEKLTWINMGDSKVQVEPAPTQNWEKLTRGGNEYHIYEDFGNFIWGRIKHLDTWQFALWLKDGKYNSSGESDFDLIPLNRESILKEIEDYENKIKELKAKL